jgi:transposase
MQVLHERCAGIDVHKKNVVVTVLLTDAGGVVTKHVQTFSTMTDDLLRLDAWLAQLEVTEVAMESTGVFWKPIYNLLAGRFAVLVVNAAHRKAVPGRQTEVRDAECIADLVRHGLLRARFLPDRPQRGLRELTRSHTTLIHARANEGNRVQQVLEGANRKLAAVATAILGKSGHDILVALVSGTSDAAAWAPWAPWAPWAAARADPATRTGAGRPVRPTAPLPHRPATGPYRLPRCQSRAGQRRACRASAPF